MAAARARFQEMRTDASGTPAAAHLRQVRKTLPSLVLPEPPPIPGSLRYLWNWFCDLASGRGARAPLAWAEVDAWARLNGVTLRPWEARVLRRLDKLWLEVVCG